MPADPFFNAPQDLSDADPEAASALLTSQELLAGSLLVHEVEVPAAVLNPGQPEAQGSPRRVQLRPLKVATLALISKAAREDAALVPLLMIKESMVAPVLALDQVRQLHAGIVQFLVQQINRISGLEADGSAAREAARSAIGQAHLRLARHYGWTPAQVAELTPGQLAVYLADLGTAPGSNAEGAP